MVGATLLVVLGIITESMAATTVGVLTALLGLLMLGMPFATPETIGAFGVRRSIVIAVYSEWSRSGWDW